MIKPQIDVSYDEVKIENFVVLRPDHLSPKQWVEFWEFCVKETPEDFSKLAEENERLKEQLEDLQED